MSMDFGSPPYPNKLQTFRMTAGFQHRQVASLLEVSNPATISDWETWKKMPSGINLIKLCILYGATPQEMYPEYYQKLMDGLSKWANK